MNVTRFWFKKNKTQIKNYFMINFFIGIELRWCFRALRHFETMSNIIMPVIAKKTITTIIEFRFLSFFCSLNTANSSSVWNWSSKVNAFFLNYWKCTFMRFEFIFCIYFLPIKPVIAPQRHAPTTTHTSNMVTNFDVAVLILLMNHK